MVYIYGAGRSLEGRSSGSKNRSLLRTLPWDGILFLGCSGSGIILTVLLSSNYDQTAVSDLYTLTFYVAWSLYGVLDVFAYFRRLSRLPALRQLALCSALATEAVLYILPLQAGNMADILQMAAIVVSAIAAFGAFIEPKCNIVVAISLMLQGTWRIHTTGGMEQSEWIQIYFSWHLLVISFTYFVLVIVQGRRENKNTDESTTDESKFASLKSSVPSTVTTDSPLDESFLQKQMPVYSASAAPPSGLSVLPSAGLRRAASTDLLKLPTVADEREGLRTVSSTSTEPCSDQLRRTEIRTSFKPRHPVVLSPPQQKRHPVSPSYEQSHAMSPAGSRHPVLSSRLGEHSVAIPRINDHPVASPAPSTTSTALSSLQHYEDKQQQQQQQQQHHQQQQHQQKQEEEYKDIVYENTVLGPMVVESEPFDRISPIEEYNTLSRHVQSVRASIKLKESGII